MKRRRKKFSPAPFVAVLCLLALVPPAIKLFARDEAATSAPVQVPPSGSVALSDFGSVLPEGAAQPVPEVQNAPDGQDAPDGQEAVLAPVISLEPQATPTPSPTPTPTPTPAPTPVPTPFSTLPVVHRARTDAKKIAITVDDCYQTNNLKTIVGLAEDAGGRLTLFPVGETLSNRGMSDLLRHCAFDLGFEIENHTYSHARIFRLPDDEMAREIWRQHAALNRALGANYQQHFLRLMGGDGDTDPRIHSYLAQLGYLGIANWSVSGSDSDMESIMNSLAPGQIYLFHTTDADIEKLMTFIPWAAAQGYQLVTVNALFGLPDNEVSPLTDEIMPQPVPGVDDHHTLKKGEYTWVTVCLQDRLRSLGYLKLDGPSTGYYGDQTAAAIADFQKDSGLPVTGEADEQTQRLLLGGT